MAPQFDRALRDLLRLAGCSLLRQGKGSHEIWHSPITSLLRQGKGSHEIWHSPITERSFAVPVGIPSRHTAKAILRQAGLPKAF